MRYVCTPTAIVLFLILPLLSDVHAQQPTTPSGPLTLEQVLQLAETRSETVAIARAGVDRAEGERVRARAGRRPQLNASASYDRALASEFSDVFGDGGSGPPCAPFTLAPAAPITERVAEIERAIECGAVGGSFFGGGSGENESVSLPFGRANTWRFNALFSQTLYSGGRLGAQAAIADVGRETADLGLTTARAQLLFDVTQAYYDAALADRLVAIAEATVQQADATVRQVQAGFEAGAQPEFELLRARVTRDNQAPVVIRQRANRDIALLRLKQMLDLPADNTLQLAASLNDDVLAPPPPFAPRLAAVEAPVPIVPPALERTAVKEAAAGLRLREASLQAARAERMPQASLTSSFTRVAYPTNVVPGGADFRSNWIVGAIIEVPVLTGGRIRGTEAVARADLEQARLQLRQVQEFAALDTQSALAELSAARAAWEASGGTVQQAARAYEIATVRFGAGVSTQLELNDARLLLQQAETNRAQAARDLQVARARLALLPDLPIGAGNAGGAGRAVTPPAAVPPPATNVGPSRRADAQPSGRIGGQQ
jgi:outer membrane protein TolC